MVDRKLHSNVTCLIVYFSKRGLTGNMDVESAKPEVDLEASVAQDSGHDNVAQNASPKFSASSLSTWAKSFKLPQPLGGTQAESSTENTGKSSFARLTGGFGLRLSPKASPQIDDPVEASETPQAGFIGTLAKGFVDTSKSAAKAVQNKARHVVSQNKRRYQVLCFYAVIMWFLVFVAEMNKSRFLQKPNAQRKTCEPTLLVIVSYW